MSFAYPEHVAHYHEVGQSVCLDNGAYSLWSQGKTTDWKKFYEWARPWLDYQTTWAIIPDVIEGGDEDNDRLIDEWPFAPDKGAPVWHPHESLERLERLRDEWSLICIGGSPEYKMIGAPKWRARMVEAMDVLCDKDGLPLTRIHMLRGLRFSAGPYPLYSADSASVARSWSGSPTGSGAAGKMVWEMMAAIDGRNPPLRWHRPEGTQEGAFDLEDVGSFTKLDDFERAPTQMVSTSHQVGLNIGGGARRAKYIDGQEGGEVVPLHPEPADDPEGASA